MSSLRSRKPYNRPAPVASRATPNGQWLHDKAPSGLGGSRPTGASRGAPATVLPSGPAAAVNSTLLVSNLQYEITPKDLIAIFGQIGTLVREPLLRYDRSGRSTGEAIISFETAAEATRAKKQFSSILAKGQPMSISYYIAPRAPRRSASAPSTTTQSLLSRVEKPPLVERLGKAPPAAKVPSGPRTLGGPIRTKGSRGAGVGKSAAKPAAPAASASKKKQPKSAEELDKELDAFMGDAETTAPAIAGDVDMA